MKTFSFGYGVLLSIVVLTLLSGCGARDPERLLIGRWRNDEQYFDFLKDGMFIYEEDGEAFAGEYTFLDNERIMLETQNIFALSPAVMDFSVSKETLTLDDVIFQRVVSGDPPSTITPPPTATSTKPAPAPTIRVGPGNGPVYENPTINGKRIDGCIISYLYPDNEACVQKTQQIIVNEICSEAGYSTGSLWDAEQAAQNFKNYRLSIQTEIDGVTRKRWIETDGAYLLSYVECQ